MSDSTTTQARYSSFLSPVTLLKPSFWLGGNWKKVISASDLPADIQTTIHQVVTRSRLMRREKFDVAEELVQHFQDGHRQGLSFTQLTSNFGDPKSAALLIRRSKIRNRSLFISMARMLPPMMACFSMAYLMLLWHYHNGRANPSIDYTSALNQELNEADEQDKAWPLYRPVWIEHQFGDGATGKYADMRREFLYVQDEAYRFAKPSDDQWPQTVAMLEAHSELLDAFREGAKRKFFGLELLSDPVQYSDQDFKALFPYQQKSTYQSYYEEYDADEILDGSSVTILLPHVQQIRQAARLFHVDTRHAADEGDSERVVENIETVFDLADQIAEAKILVNTLVAVAIGSIGFEQLEEVIADQPDILSEAQLAQLQERIEQLKIRPWLNYSFEQLSIKDMVQRCYTDDGNGDGRMTADGMRFLNGNFFNAIVGLSGTGGAPAAEAPPFDWGKQWSMIMNSPFAKSALAPTSVFTCASRKEVLTKAAELFEELEADRKFPFWQSRTSKIDGWKEHDDFLTENETEHILLSKLIPATQHVHAAINRITGRRNGAIFALAMHRYQQQQNKWPATAEELTGEHLKNVPVDILTGKPLLFKIVDGRPLVYSVGMDHDDDGGTDAVYHGRSIERMKIIPGPKSDKFEGDWILWPQNEPSEN